MTAVADQIYGRPEPQRDRWGRYMIVPAGAKKPEAHTRATTVSSTLESRYNLERWGKRQVLLGAAQRPDVIARAGSARPDDKQLLDQLVETCEAASKNDARANEGSALHAWFEQHDLGQQPTVPAPFDADLAAYNTTLQSAGVTIIPDLIERVVVLPEEKVAGTFDRIIELGNYRYIMDLKTGADLSYSWCAISPQLAIYAHGATIYDPATQTHQPMPEVDQKLAMVAHVPARSGLCQLYWVDIEAGWQAARTSMWAREWQRRTDLAQAWSPGESSEALGVRRTGLIARIQTLAFYPGALDRVAAMWPTGIPTFKSGEPHTTPQLDQVDAVLVEVEKEFQAPFGPNDPAHTINRQ